MRWPTRLASQSPPRRLSIQVGYYKFRDFRPMAICGKRYNLGMWSYTTTSSPAVAARPRHVSCVSVSSFNILQYVERNLLLWATIALELQLRTNKFCSVFFFSSWSSMLVVVKKHSLMRGVLCGKLHGGPSRLFVVQQSSIR